MTAERKPIKTNIRLEIVGANMVIEDADIELEIKKTNESAPNYCTCTVYNMSMATYNQIKSKAYYVNCYADINGAGYTLVFAGDLRNLKKPRKARKRKSRAVKHHRKSKGTSTIASEPKYFEPPIRTEDDGPDVKTIIELQDGLKSIFLNFPYSVSYKGSVSSNKILSDAISAFRAGSAVGQYDTPNETIYSNGFCYCGPIVNLIHNMCARGGCRFSIQNGIASVIRNGGKNLDYMFELNSSNCPAPEEDTNLEINVDAPIDIITINPDNYVSLDFRTVKGIKKVYKVEAKIDNYGGGSQGVKLVCKSK